MDALEALVEKLPGTTIGGRYRIISRLGAGGMGLTFRAWCADAGVPVVIKVPQPKMLDDAGFLERFLREIAFLQGLHHPHVVPIVDKGLHDRLPFVAMRFLPGGSLRHRRLRDGDGRPWPSPPSMLHHWLPAIADALDHVHAQGVVHRDVKPANIFFDASWNAFLGDFGIAKSVDDGELFARDHTLTATSLGIGSPEYMAPERFTPQALLDGRADQYALAVTVYEMLAGVRPFTGSQAHIVLEATMLPVPPLDVWRLGLPASLAEAVYRGLSKSPTERFATCEQLAAAALADVPHPPLEPGRARLLCPECETILKVSAESAGRLGTCGRCQADVVASPNLSALWLRSEAESMSLPTLPRPVAPLPWREDFEPDGEAGSGPAAGGKIPTVVGDAATSGAGRKPAEHHARRGRWGAKACCLTLAAMVGAGGVLGLVKPSPNDRGDAAITIWLSFAEHDLLEEHDWIDMPNELWLDGPPELPGDPLAGRFIPPDPTVSMLIIAPPEESLLPIALQESGVGHGAGAPYGFMHEWDPDALFSEVGTEAQGMFEGRKNPARLAQAGGGGGDTEAAVDRALKWLMAHQLPDGGWDFDLTKCPGCQGQCSHSAVDPRADRCAATALALLPFYGRGYTHQDGPYKKQVESGIAYLAGLCIDGKGKCYPKGGSMYSQGLAGICLSEAYAMTQDNRLQLPAQLALNFIAEAQDPVGGGWRYNPKQAGDTSVVGWQLMALKSGNLAFLNVNPVTIKKAIQFLDSVQDDGGVWYGYTGRGRGRSTTAVGLLCRMYLGWKKENPALQRGVEVLANIGPTADLFASYYASQIMHHMEGDVWNAWNTKMKALLLKAQSSAGHEAGSWYQGVDEGHGPAVAGRLFCTSLATMMLEVYYRHMPIYQKRMTDEVFRE